VPGSPRSCRSACPCHDPSTPDSGCTLTLCHLRRGLCAEGRTSSYTSWCALVPDACPWPMRFQCCPTLDLGAPAVFSAEPAEPVSPFARSSLPQPDETNATAHARTAIHSAESTATGADLTGLACTLWNCDLHRRTAVDVLPTDGVHGGLGHLGRDPPSAARAVIGAQLFHPRRPAMIVPTRGYSVPT
jgi:hypothetical protein